MNIYQNKLADIPSLPGDPVPSPDRIPFIDPDCCILGLQKSVFYELIMVVAVVAVLTVISIVLIKKIKK